MEEVMGREPLGWTLVANAGERKGGKKGGKGARWMEIL
jgi:hypothetical protein